MAQKELQPTSDKTKQGVEEKRVNIELTAALGTLDVGACLVLEQELALVGAALGLVLLGDALAVAPVVAEAERRPQERAVDRLRVQAEHRVETVVRGQLAAGVLQAQLLRQAVRCGEGQVAFSVGLFLLFFL